MSVSYNPNPYRTVEVWDKGVKLLQFLWRIRPYSRDMTDKGAFEVEVIFQGPWRAHYFDDWIDRYELGFCRETYLGRIVTDYEYELTIGNAGAEVVLHMQRDKRGVLRAEVKRKAVHLTRPQWGRTWRLAKAA